MKKSLLIASATTIALSVLSIAYPALAQDTPSLTTPAESQQTTVLLQLPGVYRFKVGEVRVTALSDGTVPLDLHKLLLGTSPERTDTLLARGFTLNPLETSINAFLLEVGAKRILIDTGAGELFGPGKGGKLGESLSAAGVAPSDISDILITHMHTDHGGGLVRDGKIAFPNAIVHIGKPDVDFFLDRSNAERTHYDIKYFNEAEKTLKPYVDAGQVKTFSGKAELLPGLMAELHPGHTPGSAFYTLESRGQRIVFVGDIVHAGPVQFTSPEITIAFDQNPFLAARVRQDAFATFTDERTLIAVPHLSFPGIGHVRRAESGYQWVPVEYVNRAPK